MVKEVKVKVGVDSKEAQKGLDKLGNSTEELGDDFKKSGKKSEKAMEGLTKKIKNSADHLRKVRNISGIAFATLTAGIGSAVAAYRTQEQVEIKTRAVIEATGKAAGISAEEIFKMASGLQAVTTFGDESIIAGQNLLLTFKNIGKNVFPRVTEAMLDMSVGMEQDLKSSAIQLGKALNDPITGLSTLTRIGVTFTDEQKNLIKTFQKTGDIASAQKIILKELESQFGGTARATKEGTGSFITLQNTLGDLWEEIGKKFVPVLKIASDSIEALITKFKEDDSLITFAAVAATVGVALTGVITAITTLGLLWPSLAAGAVLVGKAFLGLAGKLAFIAGPTGWAILGLAALTSGIYLFNDALTELNSEKTLDNIDAKLKRLIKRKDELNRGPVNPLFMGTTGKELQDLNEEITLLKERRELKLAPVDLTRPENQDDVGKDIFEDAILQRENFITSEKESLEDLTEFVNAEEVKKAEAQAILDDEKKAKDAKAKEAKLKLLKKEEKEAAAIRKAEAKAKAKLEKMERDRFLLDEKKFGTTIANLKVFFRTENFQGAKGASQQLLALQQSESSKMRVIGKVAALANIGISTAEGAIKAYTSLAGIPVVGPGLGILAAGSLTAFGLEQGRKVAGYAKGGEITDGISGRDSVPLIAQRGELMVPTNSFDDVIGSERARREAVRVTEEGGQTGGTVEHIISFAENAFEIIEEKLIERKRLGISTL